jgi:glycosyltransferase involved in cell wall biosynthesis
MPGTVPVSVVILAKNEAAHIAECVRSAVWAREVLVIDDESADDTAAIAESLGARVLRRRMENEGRHRNWAYAQASQPWILSLDADERVTPALAEEIARTIAAQPQLHVFAVPLRNFLGTRWLRHGGWYPAQKLRLFRQGQVRYEEALVHPRAFGPLPEGQLRGEILHYGFRDLAEAFEKLNRHTTLEARKWIEDGRRVSCPDALRRSLDRFLRAWLGKRGWRDGFLGFIMSWYQGLYHWLSYAKYWEKNRDVSIFPASPLMGKIETSPFFGKVPVSVVVLTKNEAGRLEACLQSVAWAAEVLVVDDESDDATREVAAQRGAKVLMRRMDTEGRQRNWAYAQASQPWILSLDADERVTPALAEEVARLLADAPALNGYGIPRRTFIGARWIRHGGWYPSRQLKLFRRGRFTYEEAEVHPKAVVGEAWGSLRHDLLHYSYADVAEFFGKVNRQSTLEARKWARQGRRMSLGHALWRTFDRTLRSFVLKGGWRDGMAGAIVASFAGCYQLLSYAKSWEATHAAAIATTPAPARTTAGS